MHGINFAPENTEIHIDIDKTFATAARKDGKPYFFPTWHDFIDRIIDRIMTSNDREKCIQSGRPRYTGFRDSGGKSVDTSVVDDVAGQVLAARKMTIPFYFRGMPS